MKTDFYKRYKAGCSGKYPNYENLLHHCCEHCQVDNNVHVTEVFTTISSVLSSDGHLKPVCVRKNSIEHGGTRTFSILMATLTL